MSRHRVTTQPCRAMTQQAGSAGKALGRWGSGRAHQAARQASVQVRGALAHRARASGRRAQRARGSRRAGRTGRALSERWARELARAVHLVHSARFRPGLTRYCS